MCPVKFFALNVAFLDRENIILWLIGEMFCNFFLT